MIEDRANELFISAASSWKIGQKRDEQSQLSVRFRSTKKVSSGRGLQGAVHDQPTRH